MLKYFVLLGVIAVADMVAAEMSEKCKSLPHTSSGLFHCCDVPRLMLREDMTECGFDFMGPPRLVRPSGPPSCDNDICLMKKYNLISGEDTVDKDAFKSFLDNYSSSHPDTLAMTDAIKDACLEGTLKGPADFCEPMKTRHCMVQNMMKNCPKWIDSPECKEMKQSVEDCGDH